MLVHVQVSKTVHAHVCVVHSINTHMIYVTYDASAVLDHKSTVHACTSVWIEISAVNPATALCFISVEMYSRLW